MCTREAKRNLACYHVIILSDLYVVGVILVVGVEESRPRGVALRTLEVFHLIEKHLVTTYSVAPNRGAVSGYEKG